MFDFQELGRIPASVKDLPNGSLIINRPITFYEEFKLQIWLAFSLIILLFLLVSTLISDLIRRRKLEIRLREQQYILRDTLDNIPLYVYWKDHDGNISGCNKPFETKFGGGGLNKGNICICTIEDLDFSDKEKHQLVEMEKQVQKRNKALLFQEQVLPDKSGKFRHYIISIIPFEGNDRPLSLLTLMQDVNEKKDLEEQLKQSQKMESLGRIAGGIAHDFNNLLTAIVSAAELIQSLLAYSRKAPMKFVPIETGELMVSAVNMLKRTIDKSIRIEINLSPEKLWISGDQTMLLSALLNLGINARDAMPHGGTLVFNQSREQIDEVQGDSLGLPRGEYVTFTVKDNGEGIPAEYLEKLFDPFFTTKESGKGTGLGLSGVYGCVRSHKGTITVDSPEEGGAEFRSFLSPASQSLPGSGKSLQKSGR